METQAKASKLDKTVAEEDSSIKSVLLTAKKMEEESERARAHAVEQKHKVVARAIPAVCVCAAPVHIRPAHTSIGVLLKPAGCRRRAWSRSRWN